MDQNLLENYKNMAGYLIVRMMRDLKNEGSSKKEKAESIEFLKSKRCEEMCDWCGVDYKKIIKKVNKYEQNFIE